MKEWKKIVYREADDQPTRAIVGELTKEGIFYTITNERGTLTLNEKCILAIKNAQ